MKPLLYLSLLACMQIACSNDPDDLYPYNPPENLDDGLSIGTLEEAGLDTQLILQGASKIQSGKYNAVHSMLIYRNNMLVFDAYFDGYRYQWDAPGYRGEPGQWNASMTHQIMSCTKSVTSACIGIAVDKGFIQSVQQSIFDYLPDHQQFKKDGKEAITIEHLLTMTSGLDWNEWNAPHGTSANDADRLFFECYNDPVYCVLERPLVHTPGESFTYNGGGITTLGEILRNATGMNIIEFSEEYLFGPMGVEVTRWDAYPGGQIEAASGLHLTPRDMLKLGVTYLNGGTWNGERILSEEWVQKSSVIYRNNEGINIPIEDSGKNGYGYTWWISEVGGLWDKTPMYRANGWGGQVIMVLPEKNMVVVFTGGNYDSKSSLFEILEKYILPATE